MTKWTRFNIVHLKDGVLDDLHTIDDVANEEDECDDHEGDQGGVAQVLHIDVLVLVVQLQPGCGKVEIVSIVPVPVVSDFIFRKHTHVQRNPELT